jgi:hypothetical protein
VKRLAIIVAALLIVAYGVFEARRILSGPSIDILSPTSGSATSTTLVTVMGTVENISFLTINDYAAFADEQGKFVYRYSPPPGYTVLTVAATDRFGRRVERSISFNVVTYCPVNNY